MRVKSGIKDVCRVLDVPFVDSLKISKEIDSIDTDPNLSFKMIDSWAQGDEQEKIKWQKMHELELKNEEVFRLARRFEGIPRQVGVHASGILVTPMPVSDMFPLRYDKDGTAITLWDGPTLERYGSCKLDILGLKNLDCIQMTLQNISSDLTVQDLYDHLDVEDANLYKMLCTKQTDAVFQLESDVMKGIIDTIKPNQFEDIIVINSLARPGPLSCGMHEDYAKRKAGTESISYPIHGCEDILDPTYGVIPYQENLMAISKRVAGFDDTQADSLMRKAVAKKKPEMLKILQRCFIYGKKNEEGPEGWEDNDNLPWYDPKGKYSGEIEGGLARGYTREEIVSFFKSIEKYSS